MTREKPGSFVVFSWTPEGRSVIAREPDASPAPDSAAPRDLRERLIRRRLQILSYLALLAVGGFSLGYAVQLIPG